VGPCDESRCPGCTVPTFVESLPDVGPMPIGGDRVEARTMIDAQHLIKRYGDFAAVDDVSFLCRSGTVTGFLGPNGAGKSTTLRMVTGLTPPSAGGVTIDGRPYAAHPNPGHLIGVMLDASAQHPGRTGLETLRLTGRLLGVHRARADEMLELVGLAHAAKRLVGSYSLGMRQRLGIANSLMGDPAVLILDEPANGMDPEGIRWMRHLLRDFAARGGTVLLSSHLLAEVQATVDRLVVINKGRVAADDSLEALLAGEGAIVRGLDAMGLAHALERAGFTVAESDDGALRVGASTADVGRVVAATGHVITELRGDNRGVEDLYFRLTSDDTVAA
jgi:ABC-2 type transport system ATP-binding protein